MMVGTKLVTRWPRNTDVIWPADRLTAPWSLLWHRLIRLWSAGLARTFPSDPLLEPPLLLSLLARVLLLLPLLQLLSPLLQLLSPLLSPATAASAAGWCCCCRCCSCFCRCYRQQPLPVQQASVTAAAAAAFAAALASNHRQCSRLLLLLLNGGGILLGCLIHGRLVLWLLIIYTVVHGIFVTVWLVTDVADGSASVDVVVMFVVDEFVFVFGAASWGFSWWRWSRRGKSTFPCRLNWFCWRD